MFAVFHVCVDLSGSDSLVVADCFAAKAMLANPTMPSAIAPAVEYAPVSNTKIAIAIATSITPTIKRDLLKCERFTIHTPYAAAFKTRQARSVTHLLGAPCGSISAHSFPE